MTAHAIGLDLGTTISLAAYVDANGHPRSIPGSRGTPLIPSAVHFGDAVRVGEEALELGLTDPDGLAEAFKRAIGKPHYDRAIRYCQVPPEVLTAFLIRHLIENVRRHLGDLGPVVLTVPAYFDEKKRTATQQAAKLCELDVLDIINEPTAAAIAAAHQLLMNNQVDTSARPHRILVYDLGGGTFDVTLLELTGRTFRTLATDGDIRLGGRDFDERIIRLVAERFQQRHGMDPRTSAVDLQRLWQSAREAKHALSDGNQHHLSVSHAGLLLGMELSREDFEAVIEPLVERTLLTSADVVDAAGLSWDDVDDLLLVGGSSRIPLVAKKMAQLSGRTPRLADNPDELIAHGAALYAATKSTSQILDADAQFDIVNVNAHSLGIQGVQVDTGQKINKILIQRNTPLPTSASRTFVTYKDNQSNVKVRLLEGESENPEYCNVLGDCLVRLEPALPKGSEIRVTCHYNVNGTISVAARIPTTMASAYVELRRDGFSVLEPLAVWQARLTTGEETEQSRLRDTAQPPRLEETLVRDTNDVAAILKRLDSLYYFIGSKLIEHAVPVEAVPAQRLVRELQQEIQALRILIARLERSHQDESSFQHRIAITGQLAQAKMAWEQSNRLLEHATISLGRQCADHDLIPSEAQSLRQELPTLVSLLEADRRA